MWLSRGLTAAATMVALVGVTAVLRDPEWRASLSTLVGGLRQSSLQTSDDDIAHILYRDSWQVGELTAAEYERRRSTRAPSIAGVDWTPGPAIPLFDVRTRRTDRGDVVVPVLTDVLVRATLPRSRLQDLPQALRDRIVENVVITFPLPDTDFGGPTGTARDVADRLDLAGLQAAGMTGKGVIVGIVDNGINLDALTQQHLSHMPACGAHPPCFEFDEDLSSGTAHAGANPANSGFTHGGMVAFDVMIAAPAVTLADVVLSTAGTARIGDAIEAYNILALKLALRRLDGRPAPAGVVMVNSWGILDPAKDDPKGTYARNPNHLFKSVIDALADLGIDFVFAAGNCGPGGDQAACGTLGRTIYGGNGYERVVTVAAANVDGTYLKYSSQGPGWTFGRKPDVTGFSEFVGFHAVDAGTSAAAPTVAGLIAAYRSKHPFQHAQPDTSVDAMRDRIIRAVGKCFPPGKAPPHHETIGSGIVDGRCLVIESARRSQRPET